MTSKAYAVVASLFTCCAWADIGYRAQLLRFDDHRVLLVYAINDFGVVTGEAVDPASGRFYMIVWSGDEGFSDLGTLYELGQTVGVAINNSNVIVGFGNTADQALVVRWSDSDGFTTYPALYSAAVINDSGWIAGQYTVDWSYGNAVLWRPGVGYTVIGDLPGGPRDALPTAINNSGVVCGNGYGSNGHRAFLWDLTNGLRAMPALPDGALPNFAIDMNNLGQVVGSTYTLDDAGFLWDPVTGYTRLEFGSPSGVLEPSAINDRTEIVGVGIENPAYRSWVYDPQRGYRNVEESIDPCSGITTPLNPVDINNIGQILCFTREGTYGPQFGYLLTPYVVGDLNDDNLVDLSDLATLLANFGRSGDADYAAGDLDCDADVDLQDLAKLLSSFGESYP